MLKIHRRTIIIREGLLLLTNIQTVQVNDQWPHQKILFPQALVLKQVRTIEHKRNDREVRKQTRCCHSSTVGSQQK